MKNNIKPKFLIGQKVKCFRCVFTTIESINVSASKFEY